MNDRGQFEIVTGADGRELIRIPASVLGAPPEEISALRAEIADLKKAQQQEPNTSAKVRLGLDSAARENTTRAIETFAAAADRWTAAVKEASALQLAADEKREARFVSLLEAAVSAFAAIKAPVVSPTPITFAPNILPAEVRNVVTVLAQLPPRSTRTATITTDANGTQSIVLDAAS